MTRQSLRFKCTTKGCPWPKDEEIHVPWCLGIEGVEHWADKPTHQHFPKKGMGGNNPKSRIVAILCPPCHDRIDNGTSWGNGVNKFIGGGEQYVAFDLHGNTLIERKLGADRAAEDSLGGSAEPPTDSGGDTASAAPSAPGASAGAEAATSRSTSNAAEGVKAIGDPTLPHGLSSVHTSAPALTPLDEDWTVLSDDDLQAKYEAAEQMQGVAFLLRCKAVHTYREKHTQQWGEKWTDQAIERFQVSRPTLYAYANLYQISLTPETNYLEQMGPLTDSMALMQSIGRRSLEAGREAMGAAIALYAEFNQPPTVAALAHKLGVEAETKARHECPKCGAIHPVKEAT